MNRRQIEQEFKKIDHEFGVNKPDFTPFPPDVIKRREFLLFAQVHLANILDAKLRRDKWDEEFEAEMYNRVMEIYYDWDKNKRKFGTTSPC